MSASLVWQIDPLQQAERLSSGLRNRGIRIAMSKASAPVKAAVVSRAPIRFGFLKKAQKIKVKNYKANNVWVSVIGATSAMMRNKGKRKRGKHKGQPIRHRPSNYQHLVERGTKRAHARPFLAPAQAATANTFREVLFNSIAEFVEQNLPR